MGVMIIATIAAMMIYAVFMVGSFHLFPIVWPIMGVLLMGTGSGLLLNFLLKPCFLREKTLLT